MKLSVLYQICHP